MAALGTSTIRVSNETKAELTKLAARRGTTLQDTARDAAEALWRQELAAEMRARLGELSDDPAEWAAFLADGRSTDVADGVGEFGH